MLSFTLPNGAAADITAGGLPDDRLVAIAAEMSHAGIRPVLTGGSTDGHELLWTGLVTGSSLEEVFAHADVRTELRYGRRADDTFISISAAPRRGAADVLTPFVLGADGGVEAPAITVGGRQVIAGSVPGLGDARVARWIEGDELVTVISDLALPEVLDVAATVRAATRAEWRHAAWESGFDVAAEGAGGIGAGALHERR